MKRLQEIRKELKVKMDDLEVKFFCVALREDKIEELLAQIRTILYT